VTHARLGAALLGLAATLSACVPDGPSGAVVQTYEAECASCHGADGHGAPGRRGVEPFLDFRRSAMVKNSDRALLFQRVAYGYGTMPGFAHKLSQGELEDLVDYVQLLAGR